MFNFYAYQVTIIIVELHTHIHTYTHIHRMSDDSTYPRNLGNFIANCRRYYTSDRHCTVDEQLLGFKGLCSFRVYMKAKPDKYGFKIFSLNDATTSYIW